MTTPSLETAPETEPTAAQPLLPHLRQIVGLLELVAVFALTLAFSAFASEHRLTSQMLNFGSSHEDVLNPGETRLYLVGVMLGLPIAFLLVDATMRLRRVRAATLLDRMAARPRLAVAALACAAVVLAELLARLFSHAQFTDDERMYLWEAQNLLHRSFTDVRPQPREFFLDRFWYMLPVDGGRWGSTYPPGAPMLIALGSLVGAPHLPQLLCVGLIVWMVGRLAQEAWGAREAVLGAGLVASSPMLLLGGASLHNSVPTALCTIAALRAALASRRGGRRRDLSICAAWIGGALVCRPLDAVIAAVPCAVLILWGAVGRIRQGKGAAREVGGVVAAVACGVPFVAVLLASQKAVTGSYLVAPLARLAESWPGATLFGFGMGPFGVMHTEDLALSKLVVLLARVDGWAFGWPLALLPPLVVLAGLGRDRAGTTLLSFIGLHFLASFFYIANSVHTFGSSYEVVLVPMIGLLTARLVTAAAAGLARFEPAWGAIPHRAVAALTVVSVLLFWPTQLSWLVRLADGINAPIDAAAAEAARGPIIVFHRALQPPVVAHPTSWVFWPPLARGDLSDRVLWASDWGLHNRELLQRLPGRRAMFLSWRGITPSVIPWDPEQARPDSDREPPYFGPIPLYLEQPRDLIEAEVWRPKKMASSADEPAEAPPRP